jgi:hypothetical protein
VPADGALALESSYDEQVVAEIKKLPHNARQWDKANKRWLIEPSYGAQIAGIVQRLMGITITVPAAAQAQVDSRVFTVEYLGATKEQPNGDWTARGFVNGGWNIVFPEPVLRTWFKDELPDMKASTQPAQPAQASTLYAVLGIDRTVDPDQIKPAYRRMAMQWHPDRCKEPDAAVRFHRIQTAYDILNDPNKRRKYDIGLQLEYRSGTRKVEQPISHHFQHYGYRAPLRCGLVLVVGVSKMGRFDVQKIANWQDVVRDGRTMISSWPRGADTFQIDWI